MSGMVRCFASIADCFYGTGEWSAAAAAGKAAGGGGSGGGAAGQAARTMPEVTLDSANMGEEREDVTF